MVNKAGKTVQPTMEAFQAAASNADWAHAPGYYLILTDQPGDKSWPITASTFILMHKEPADKAASAEAIKFFKFAFEKGGKMAEDLDYIPMPDIGGQADREDLVGRHQELIRSTATSSSLRQGAESASAASPIRRLATVDRSPAAPAAMHASPRMAVETASGPAIAAGRRSNRSEQGIGVADMAVQTRAM